MTTGGLKHSQKANRRELSQFKHSNCFNGTETSLAASSSLALALLYSPHRLAGCAPSLNGRRGSLLFLPPLSLVLLLVATTSLLTLPSLTSYFPAAATSTDPLFLVQQASSSIPVTLLLDRPIEAGKKRFGPGQPPLQPHIRSATAATHSFTFTNTRLFFPLPPPTCTHTGRHRFHVERGNDTHTPVP